mmetsp:Transcript_22801/g.65736  ORF Transcript_22801/g.65736 Transcript_22801/m.65736 type:complete len:309 (-) Transcript_22801:81-1007(-)
MGRKKKDTDKNDTSPLCPVGHALERRVAADGEYECDVCAGDIASGMCFFGCSPCDYSLCNTCYIKAATGELQLRKAPSADTPAVDCVAGDRVDPDVAELCDHFTIEDRIMLKLNEAMKTRQSTFAGDLEKLWEELATARSPAGLLMAKIRQMQEGTFVGTRKAPEPVQRLIDRYHLDKDARTKLTSLICSRPDTMDTDLYEIQRRLETSGNPSATVMMMIVKLHRGEKLPEPLRGTPHRDFADLQRANGGTSAGDRPPGGIGGSGIRDRDRDDRDRGDRGDRGNRGDRDRDRERRRSRSHSRSGTGRR